MLTLTSTFCPAMSKSPPASRNDICLLKAANANSPGPLFFQRLPTGIRALNAVNAAGLLKQSDNVDLGDNN